MPFPRNGYHTIAQMDLNTDASSIIFKRNEIRFHNHTAPNDEASFNILIFFKHATGILVRSTHEQYRPLRFHLLSFILADRILLLSDINVAGIIRRPFPFFMAPHCLCNTYFQHAFSQNRRVI